MQKTKTAFEIVYFVIARGVSAEAIPEIATLRSQ
jgi:hypothetical protein